MGLKLNTASGGSVSIEPTNTASNYTLTVPAQTGTVAINGPAFSAYLSTAQTPSAGVWTKLTFNTKEFDTNNNFDATTNYRFTPTVAGYYQINAHFITNTTSGVYGNIGIYKNGSVYKQVGMGYSNTSAGGVAISALIYCNGSTDYLEIYGLLSGGSFGYSTIAANTGFSGSMVRSA